MHLRYLYTLYSILTAATSEMCSNFLCTVQRVSFLGGKGHLMSVLIGANQPVPPFSHSSQPIKGLPSSQTRLGVKIRILFAGKGHDSHFYLFILLRNSRFNSIQRHLSSSRPLLRKCFRLEDVKTLDMKSKRSGGGSRSAHVAVTG